jgi:hypothetical protein
MLNGVPVLIADIIGATPTNLTTTGRITRPIRTGERGPGSERTAAAKQALLTIMRTDSAPAAITGNLGLYGADLANPVGGRPLGNAFATAEVPNAQAFTPNGTDTQFQSQIPFAAIVAPAANADWFLAETAAFRLTGTVALSGVTLTGTGTAFDTELAVGDTITIAGALFTIATVASATAATTVESGTAAALSVALNTTDRRRFKLFSGAAASGPEQFTITNVGGFARFDFAVAPPTGIPSLYGTAGIPGASPQGLNVYRVSLTEVLSQAPRLAEQNRIRSRSVLFAFLSAAQAATSRTFVSLNHLVG